MIFTVTKTNAGSVGEKGLLDIITTGLGSINPDYPNGIGDDCAVTQINSPTQLLTTDTLSYGIHFDQSVSAQSAGEKLIKRNISDIAAMGGIPENALLTLLCGPNTAVDWIKEFIEGIRKASEKYGILIVGGDISSVKADQFSAVLALTGRCATPKLRKTARSHDTIYVTGTLGGSILGKHYTFTPRLDEGQWLAESSRVTSMMDLTDGLAQDLRELLPANSSARLDLANIPIDPAAEILAQTSGKTALEHAFVDGEDYELLFTCKSMEADALETAWHARFPQLEIHRIGVIGPSSDKGIYLDAQNGIALPWSQGYAHFGAE